MTGKRPTLKREDDRDEPSPAERALSAASAVFAVVVIGYMVWHGYALPDGAFPEARVLSVRPADNATLVTVEGAVRGDRGLLTLAIEVACDDPAPRLEFQNVPSGGARSGTVRCPAGTTDPRATVASFTVA